MSDGHLKHRESLWRRVGAWLLHPQMNGVQMTLLVSLLLVAGYNAAFWGEIGKIAAETSQSPAFLGSLFVLLFAFLNLCLSLVAFRYILKPSVIAILAIAAFAAYFMKSYGLMIDRALIRNLLTSDGGDMAGLLSVRMFYYLIVLGVAPIVFVCRTRIRYKGFMRDLFMVSGSFLVSLMCIAVVMVVFYRDYISLGKNYNYIRHLINPVNSVYAIGSLAKKTLFSGRVVVRPIGQDAKLEEEVGGQKKKLVILVVGEAARAGNFSLNGYGRKTNPLLEKEDVMSFTDVSSCGTVSTTSIPCMFSHFGRAAFSDAKAERHEGLLDVLSHAGVRVLWRDNNAGCKGVCKRVETERFVARDGRILVESVGGATRAAAMTGEEFCVEGECQDIILLEQLQAFIDQVRDDTLIVLHQRGSYGPEYYRRSPPPFKVFTPECTTNQLQECRPEELVNAYDNTILYTDYFLTRVIDLLKRQNGQFQTAMMYLSDYGESLGEKNIYLHGLPYLIAPEEQKHVPFIVWLADAFFEPGRLDQACLRQHIGDELSHDNVFHSVLGLMGVRTEMYRRELDIFASCRQ